MNETKKLGNQGEQLVCTWLTNQGFFVVEKNFRVREAEIDIIAKREGLLCFIEVKTRKSRHFPLSQIITTTKQKKIVRAAKHYLSQNKSIEAVCRFDVALVEGQEQTISYIPNAFMADTHI